MRLFLLSGLLLLALSSYAQTGENRVLVNARDGYILPAYQQLASATQALSSHLALLCDKPDAAHLGSARSAYQQTLQAWSFIEWLRLGPVLQNNRVERFLFFPDRKSRGLRQVKAALREQPDELLEPETLQTKSVALQGLGALDVILFGKGAETLALESRYRCQFARSISHNLQHIAADVALQWQQNQRLRMDWSRPDSDNRFYRTEREAMNLLLSTIIHGLEAIRDSRIAVFLRENRHRDRPKSAAYWRSAATMQSVLANLQGLEALFIHSQIETILPVEAAYLSESIRFEFRQSMQTAKALDAPIATLLADPEQREALQYFNLTLEILLERFNHEFAPAAGLAAGFSFGDGD